MSSERTYRRKIAQLQGMIADMLWVQPSYNGSPSCAYCGEQRHLHTEHCAATKLVAEKWPEADRVRLGSIEED